MENRKGIWISEEIRTDRNLTRTEREALVEIINLSELGKCFASNKHFAEYLGVKKSTAANVVYSLRKKGYISVELIYKDTKEIDKRIITYLNPYSKKNEYPLNEKMNTPIHLKMKDNKTSENITIELNTIENNKENIPAPECPCDYEKVELNQPDIEDTKSQWHWKNEKMYNDYLGKVLINYLWNIAKRNRSDNKSRQFYVEFWEKLIKKYFKYYRINTGKWHPWYKEELLEKNIKSFYDFGLNKEREEHTVNSECFEEYTKRFFSHNSFSDYTLSVFSSERVLTGLYGEIAEEYSVFEEMKEAQ